MKANSIHKDDAPTATEEERFCYCDTTEKRSMMMMNGWSVVDFSFMKMKKLVTV
jgi:hypothetical protein